MVEHHTFKSRVNGSLRDRARQGVRITDVERPEVADQTNFGGVILFVRSERGGDGHDDGWVSCVRVAEKVL